MRIDCRTAEHCVALCVPRKVSAHIAILIVMKTHTVAVGVASLLVAIGICANALGAFSVLDTCTCVP